MGDSFYVQLDENRFDSTGHTMGPWSREAQHAGPPSALLARAIERVDPTHESRVGRISLDILGPVPIAPLDVTARVVRPGRSVELVEASLRSDDREVMHARAWRIRVADLDFESPVKEELPPPGPRDTDHEIEHGEFGYGNAMDWLYIKGSFEEPGPATCWLRMRMPLIDGEEPSPLVRVMVAADCGNGISASLDFTKWFFINPDLSVYLHRMPRGEWICLDAVTMPERTGMGVASSTIYDEDGAIGKGQQSLFIGPR